jgi:hypothetical protein
MALAEAYARMMAALLPPSRMWRLDASAVLAKLLLASSDELERVDGRSADLIEESDPRTTDELLPDFERMFRLSSSGTLAERRARVVALTILRQRFRPVDFQTALAPLLGLAPADVVVVERTHAAAVAMGDPREIYRFFVFRNPALPGTFDLVAAQAVVDLIKPSHTVGTVIQSINFLCDDPDSLCDRDNLGV